MLGGMFDGFCLPAQQASGLFGRVGFALGHHVCQRLVSLLGQLARGRARAQLGDLPTAVV